MRVAFLFILLFLLSFTFNYAYAQEPIIMEQVTPNGKMKVQLFWPEVLPNQLYEIELRFLDPQSNELITDLVMYNISVIQNDETIEFYEEEHTEYGNASFEVVFPEDGTGPAQVVVFISAMNFGTNWTAIKEQVVFNVQVVPEFPFMLTVVMTISFVIIMVITRVTKLQNYYLRKGGT